MKTVTNNSAFFLFFVLSHNNEKDSKIITRGTPHTRITLDCRNQSHMAGLLIKTY